MLPVHIAVSRPRSTDKEGSTATFASYVELQFAGVVIVTVYVPLIVGVIVCEVAPVDQLYVLPGFPASSTIGSLIQVVTFWRRSRGNALNWSVMASELLHPFALVTVTVYVPDALAVMLWVVGPLFH
jgi:hypothetical protein